MSTRGKFPAVYHTSRLLRWHRSWEHSSYYAVIKSKHCYTRREACRVPCGLLFSYYLVRETKKKKLLIILKEKSKLPKNKRKATPRGKGWPLSSFSSRSSPKFLYSLPSIYLYIYPYCCCLLRCSGVVHPKNLRGGPSRCAYGKGTIKIERILDGQQVTRNQACELERQQQDATIINAFKPQQILGGQHVSLGNRHTALVQSHASWTIELSWTGETWGVLAWSFKA